MLELFFVATVGACVGSFTLLIIDRLLASEKGIFFGRSKCDFCHRILKWTQLIPLFSYLKQKGKCSSCGKNISLRYLFSEVSFASVFVLAYLTSFSLQQFLALLLLWSSWLALSIFDLKTKTLDLYLLLLSLLLAPLVTFSFNLPWSSAFFGALVTFLFFGLQYLFGRLLQKDLLGSGDILLGLSLGLSLGLQKTILALFLSYFLGSLVGLLLILSHKATRQSLIPLAPFLVAGALSSWAWGDYLLLLYFNHFTLPLPNIFL